MKCKVNSKSKIPIIKERTMISDKLKQARDYEQQMGAMIPDEKRPVYHLTPWAGWMNDPNGFSFYDGKYHLFFQYYPFATEWGPMHWGHAVTKDLVSWEFLPTALAPDMPYDAEGCWSGSAVELPDGRQLLVYTGREPFINNEGREEIRQVQCLAFGDGRDYVKYERNPVLTAADLPEGASIYDFRDPKVWKDEKDGCYHMVVASRAADGYGQVLNYVSVDGISWEYKGVLDASRGEVGSMWECPDFFKMGPDAFIIASPMEMKMEGEFLNFHGNAYFKGRFDEENHRFIREEVHALDFGYDFYAAQTMLAPDGRRLLIAWMTAWENMKGREHPQGWAGMMTLPRELTFVDGHLIQTPVKEIEAYRRNPVISKKVPVSGRIRQEGISGRSVDLTVDVSPAWNSDYDSFEIRFAEGEIRGRYYTVILRYDKKEGVITLDRSVSGYANDVMAIRRIELDRDCLEGSAQGGNKQNTSLETGSDITFRILLDRFSAEIFVNGGRYVLSSVLETDLEADGISFVAQGDAVINIEKYDIAKV